MLFDFLFSDFFRQSLVSAAVDIHCTDVKWKTFSLSRESVLTSMDGEEIGD